MRLSCTHDATDASAFFDPRGRFDEIASWRGARALAFTQRVSNGHRDSGAISEPYPMPGPLTAGTGTEV